MKRLTTQVLALLAIAFLGMTAVGAAARADEIHLVGVDSREDLLAVQITTINCKTVFFKYLREDGSYSPEQQEEMRRVERVVFTEVPPDYDQAQRYFEAGDHDRAIKAFDRAMKDRSRNPWVDQYSLFYIARCYEEKQDAAKVAETFGKLLKDFPDSVHLAGAHQRLADIYYATGKKQDAKKTLEELIQKVRRNNLNKVWAIEANLQLARYAETEKDYAAALRAYGEVAGESRDLNKDVFHQARLGEARCQYADPARRASAEEIFRSLTDRELGASAAVLAGAYNGLAAALFEKGEYRPSLLAALRVVVMYGNSAPSELPQGLFHAARGFYFMKQERQEWEERAAVLNDRLMRGYPTSEWAQKNYKKK